MRRLGYEPTRQTGSHVRLTTLQHGEHHLTVPVHDSLRIGTLASIVGEIAGHFGMARDAVVETLFG
jgi:predicted RNA binding protein YcfA (HicA-like mRNA interferase family)